MANITDKTVTSKYQPKSTNVIWVDTSQNPPVEKHFINGRWVAVSGGGGGASSSNPTEADATKVWQVTPVLKSTKTETFDILHEYTDTFHYDANLISDAINLDKFTAGSKCILTVTGGGYDGNTYEGFIVDFGGPLLVEFSETPFVFYVTQDGLVFNWGGSDTELTLSLSVEQSTPIYDYSWAPGVKVPIPTAEDEGKILVVTKVAGDNTSIIVPEQPVPADVNTPLTDVDLTKFVVGNTVKVTIVSDSQTITAIGVIILEGVAGVMFYIQELDNTFWITEMENSLITNASELGLIHPTIKLEYIELNYEYQLQENSGGGGSSNILYCEGSVDRGIVTAYIDSSELDNPQITTIVVSTEGPHIYNFYRMNDNNWLVSGFSSFENRSDWIKQWNTEGQYPTIEAYYSNR